MSVTAYSPSDYLGDLTIDSGTGSTLSTYSCNPSIWAASSSTSSGSLVVSGDIVVKGRNLTTVLDQIEERLGMLQPNPALEEGWDELKNLGIQYRELEKKLLQQQQTFDILKK